MDRATLRRDARADLPAPEARSTEAARQAAVLAAWQAWLPRDATLDETQACLPHVLAAGLRTDAAGLRAYQGHARMQARQILATAYPTVGAMLGAPTLDALADRLWRQNPPWCGDLGEWGEGLAALIAATPSLHAWPWLADSARLDWACHLCARAADAQLDAASLQKLSSDAPETLSLVLKPAVLLLESRWPVAALRQAHALPLAEQTDAAARALDEHAETEAFDTVVVHRDEDTGEIGVHRLQPGSGAWMRMLAGQAPHQPVITSNTPITQGGQLSLAEALTRMSHLDDDFDFTAWLTQALHEGWLWRVDVLPLTCRSGGS